MDWLNFSSSTHSQQQRRRAEFLWYYQVDGCQELGFSMAATQCSPIRETHCSIRASIWTFSELDIDIAGHIVRWAKSGFGRRFVQSMLTWIIEQSESLPQPLLQTLRLTLIQLRRSRFGRRFVSHCFGWWKQFRWCCWCLNSDHSDDNYNIDSVSLPLQVCVGTLRLFFCSSRSSTSIKCASYIWRQIYYSLLYLC